MAGRISFQAALLISAGAAAAFGLAAGAGFARAQEAGGPELQDFRAQLENHSPPNEAQVKTLLEGARARQRSDKTWAISDAKLRTFRTNGAPELLAETPFCLYDTTQQTVSSDGPVQIRTVDQAFLLEGQGFLLRQTNSSLIISNRVHTVVRNLSARTRP